MKMNKKAISPYNIALTILAFCLCLVLSFAILTPSQQVFADYNDLPENTIVNFNQILQFSVSSMSWKGLTISHNNYNIKVVGTSSFTSGDSNVYGFFSNLDVVEGKQYYFSTNSEYWQIFTYGQGTSSTELIQSIFTASSTGSANLTLRPFVQSHIANGSVLNDNFSAYIICLSDMFGIGNEPNLEQCKQLFTADYYNYTTGTEMPLSKGYLQGYQDGANDIWESLTTTYNNDILGTITTPSSINGFESNVAYDSQYSRYLVEGLAQLDFGATITSQVNYKGTYWISNYTGGIYVVFFKYEGSVLTPLIISEITQAPSNVQNSTPYCDITFNINNVEQIYFGFFTSTNNFNNDTSTTMYCWSSELQLNTIDVALLIQSSYTRGVIETTKEYSEGGSKYESIYNLGKAEGIAESNGYATGLDVIATTFTQVFSIFNIEILPGIPLTIFILMPLLVGLIFFIVKMTKGD